MLKAPTFLSSVNSLICTNTCPLYVKISIINLLIYKFTPNKKLLIYYTNFLNVLSEQYYFSGSTPCWSHELHKKIVFILL